MHHFRPKLLDTLQGYTARQFGQDAAAGLTVGVLALPLAMAFAIASGVSPAAGIWTAIIAGLLTSLLGGSRVQIGGPTGAFIPIVYGVVVAHGVDNLQVATLLAGVLLLVMGMARLGSLIRFIPIAVVIGFTNGIAVVIFLSQIKDFFGLQLGATLPAEFFERGRLLIEHAHTFQWPSLLLGSACIAAFFVWAWLGKRFAVLLHVPSQLAVLIFGTAASLLLSLPLETIGSRFGGIPQWVPMPGLPTFSISTLGQLLVPAMTIALLGAIESLLSARVADGAIDDRHDPNQELVAQGLSNMVAPLFGGFAATGAIARTATNVRAGGRTPVAGIIHAATLLLIVLVAAPLANHVPIVVLASIVMVTAVRMGEWHEFARLRHFSWNYGTVLVSTFLLTVLFDLTIAVEIGMVLACLFFIYRMQALTVINRLGSAEGAAVEIFQVQGSLFFGAVARLDDMLDPASVRGKVVAVDLREVLNVDTSGVDWLRVLSRTLKKRGITLLLCGLRAQPASLLRRSGLQAELGEANVLPDLAAAQRRAQELGHA